MFYALACSNKLTMHQTKLQLKKPEKKEQQQRREAVNSMVKESKPTEGVGRGKYFVWHFSTSPNMFAMSILFVVFDLLELFHGLYKHNALFLDYNLLEVLYKNTIQFKFSSIFRKSKFCTKKNHAGNDGSTSNNDSNGNGVHILLYLAACFFAFDVVWQARLYEDINIYI